MQGGRPIQHRTEPEKQGDSLLQPLLSQAPWIEHSVRGDHVRPMFHNGCAGNPKKKPIPYPMKMQAVGPLNKLAGVT
jgi:hypothetical protein